MGWGRALLWVLGVLGGVWWVGFGVLRFAGSRCASGVGGGGVLLLDWDRGVEARTSDESAQQRWARRGRCSQSTVTNYSIHIPQRFSIIFSCSSVRHPNWVIAPATTATRSGRIAGAEGDARLRGLASRTPVWWVLREVWPLFRGENNGVIMCDDKTGLL